MVPARPSTGGLARPAPVCREATPGEDLERAGLVWPRPRESTCPTALMPLIPRADHGDGVADERRPFPGDCGVRAGRPRISRASVRS